MDGRTEQIQKKPRRTVKTSTKVLISVAAVLLFAALAMLIYVGDYYHARDLALETLRQPADGITITESKNRIVFEPEHPEAGLIFYPGGKVQYESYAPLMERCAEQGLLRMPGNLAVLDMDAA